MSGADEEGIGPLELGRKRYQKKDYKAALDAFTKVARPNMIRHNFAVSISDGGVKLIALDHRAATYEKLDQLQLALRDSKKMIDIKPELAKGYLRCGKVLQLKGEKELALKIYERGLSKVKFGTDNERNALQSMFNKLLRALNPTKSLDPLEYLPNELALLVIQNLRIRDRTICLRVSKAWKRLLESSHKLWTTFDTTNARKAINQHSLRAYLRRSNYTLSKAIVHSRAQFDDTKWIYLTRTCQKLTDLTINGSGIIGDTLSSALPFASSLTSIVVSANRDISYATVVGILNHCQKTLVHAAFLSVKNSVLGLALPQLDSLRTLDIRSSTEPMLPREFSDGTLPTLIPNLQALTINCLKISNFERGLRECKNLQTFALIDTDTLELPPLPASLKHLDVSKNHWMVLPPRDEDQAWEFPLLESFNCSNTGFNGRMIKQITNSSVKAGNLRSLKLGTLTMEIVTGLATDEYPVSTTVEELSLGNSLSAESRIIDIVNLYPQLLRLDVSYTNITGVAVKHFVGMGVAWLRLDECPHVSPDAVEYARGKGVEVEFNFPSRRNLGFRDRVAAAR